MLQHLIQCTGFFAPSCLFVAIPLLLGGLYLACHAKEFVHEQKHCNVAQNLFQMLNAIKLASQCRATNQFNPPPLPGQALAVNAQVLGQVDPVSACYLHYRVAMASTERLPMHRVPQEGPPLWEAIIPASGIKAGAESLSLVVCPNTLHFAHLECRLVLINFASLSECVEDLKGCLPKAISKRVEPTLNIERIDLHVNTSPSRC
jgi:hypothetical protein